MADGLLPRTLRTRKMVEFLDLFLMWPVLFGPYFVYLRVSLWKGYQDRLMEHCTV